MESFGHLIPFVNDEDEDRKRPTDRLIQMNDNLIEPCF